MNVREDKMTNHRGLPIGKPSLTCCVPVLLRVSRRFKQENILLDVVNHESIQSLPIKQNRKHHKCVYKQKLKRVPTYFICFNHFNGTEPTVIYFVNIPFSMQKGQFLSLNPLLNAGGVISV